MKKSNIETIVVIISVIVAVGISFWLGWKSYPLLSGNQCHAIDQVHAGMSKQDLIKTCGEPGNIITVHTANRTQDIWYYNFDRDSVTISDNTVTFIDIGKGN